MLVCSKCQVPIPTPSYRLSAKNKATRLCTSCFAKVARTNGQGPSRRNASIAVSAEAVQVTLGSILGDGNIEPPVQPNGNWGLAIKHGLKQERYLLWKAALLGSLVRKVDYPTERVRLRCVRHPYFSGVAAQAIRDGVRRVAPLLLDQMGPLAYAVWYMDDGSLSNPTQPRADGYWEKSSIRLCTQGFPEGDTLFLREYLSKKFDIEVTKASWHNPRNPSVPYIGVRMHAENADTFRAYFAHIVPPPCLSYKWSPLFLTNTSMDRSEARTVVEI